MKSSSFCAVVFTCVLPLTVQAQSTWVGGSGGNVFNNAANWSPSSVPSSNADLVFNTTSNTNVGFNSLPYTANSLTFGSAATNQFFLNGTSGTLTIGAGGLTTNSGNGGVVINNSLPLALGANQTWTIASTVTVNSSLSGAFSLTKAGNGALVLNGNNSYSGGTIVNGGALYLSSTNNASGAFAVGSSGTLSSSNSDVTLGGAVSLASGATLGGALNGQGGHLDLDGTVTVASTAHTLNLGSGAEIFFSSSSTVSASAATALTVHGDGTGLAVFSGSQSNINTMTADSAAVVFTNAASLPSLSSNSLTATNGGYFGIAAITGGPTPPTFGTLLGMIDRSTFDGSIGFDTDDQADHPNVYSENIDLTGFTDGHVRLGSLTSAVLTGTITPVAQSYDFGSNSAGRDGVLVVKSALDDHGGATGVTVVSPSASGGAAQRGMILGLQGTNNFSGNVSVSYSSLLIDSAGALPATASISLGAYSYAGYTEVAGFANFAAFTARISSSTATSVLGIDSHDAIDAFVNSGSGTSVHTVSGPVDLSGFTSIYLGTHTGATIDGNLVAPTDGTIRLVNLGDRQALTVNSTLSNAHGVVAGMTGSSGAVVLNGNNTFSGGTTLLGGGLLAGNSNALSTGDITVSNSTNDHVVLGATANGITLANNIAVTGELSIGTGGLDDTGSSYVTDTHAITLSGVISGAGRLYLTAPTTLTNANTYTGGTYVTANTTVTNNNSLGSSFVDLGYNAVLTFDTDHPVIGVLANAGSFIGGAGTGNINLTSSVLDLTINQTSNQSFSGQFTGTAAHLIKNGGAQLTLLGNNIGHVASTTINAGSVSIGDSITNGVSYSGSISAVSGTSLFLRPASGQTLTYNGSISGAGSVTVNGNNSGVVNIAGGSSTFTGSTSVNAGTLRLNGDNLWSNASAVTVNNGATLRLDGDQTIRNLSGGGTVNLATSGKAMTVDSATGTTFAGAITGSGSLVKTGAQSLILSGNNTFTGTTTVSAGTLQLGAGSASGSLAGAVSVGSGATLAINRSGTFTFASAISGAGGVTTSTGTITLSNANTYGGNTTISSGTLKLGASGSIANSAHINVAGGATFDVSSVSGGFSLVSGQTVSGTGSISGAFTAASGSGITPGSTTGNLTFNSGLTLATGATLNFNLGTNNSQILVTSGLLTGPTGTGGLTLNLVNSGGFSATTYNLINFTGATLSGFDLADLTLGTTISGYNYSLGFSGNFLQLTAISAVPESSSYAALLGLGAVGITFWRRRRSA